MDKRGLVVHLATAEIPNNGRLAHLVPMGCLGPWKPCHVYIDASRQLVAAPNVKMIANVFPEREGEARGLQQQPLYTV